MPLKMFQEKDKTTERSIKHTIAIAAGKGGVGKSSVTVNLALALQQLGYAVGVMDTDIYGPSIRRMLPEDRMPSQRGKTIVPALCHGIRMISMAYFRKEDEASAVRAPIANGVVTQFIRDVEWGDLDYLLIDFPPGTGDIQLTLSQQANLTGAIMVTTPQEVAVMDVRKAMHLFQQVQVPIIGIVENMSYYHNKQSNEREYLFGRGGGERLARDSGVPLLGTIPVDSSICHCGDNGKSLFTSSDPNMRAVAEIFLSLGKEVVDHVMLIAKQSQNCLQRFELTWREM